MRAQVLCGLTMVSSQDEQDKKKQVSGVQGTTRPPEKKVAEANTSRVMEMMPMPEMKSQTLQPPGPKYHVTTIPVLSKECTREQLNIAGCGSH